MADVGMVGSSQAVEEARGVMEPSPWSALQGAEELIDRLLRIDPFYWDDFQLADVCFYCEALQNHDDDGKRVGERHHEECVYIKLKELRA